MARRIEFDAVVSKSLGNSAAAELRRGAKAASPLVVRASIQGADFKKLSQPLGKISGDLNQFQSSLDASVARVLAFGASASVLSGVASALKGVVDAGIEVEKSLTKINTILNLSQSSLAKFSSQLFDVARKTASSFQEISGAALELSRQGLGAEETLKRLTDAMILSKLSGLDSAAAVDTLTASINGFNAEGVTSTEIINRLASVDAAFAVSTRDLADALARSGAVAQDAGVSFNQLIASVTAVQQATARGGAVIGNGLKSIFTRIQRAGVREALEGIGVATSNADGSFRGAIPILQDYAKAYENLSDSQKSSTSEQIAGVFQINTLKALMKDLNKEYSIYSGALNTANGATDEAEKRMEQLNQTTSALLTNTQTSLKEFGAALSDLAANEGLRNVLSLVNTIASKLADALSEEKGSAVAKAIMGGIGNFIAGPGLVIMGQALFKLLKFLTSEVATAFKQIQNLNAGKQEQLKVEQSIGGVLKDNDNVIQKIIASEGNRKIQEEQILGVIRNQAVAAKEVQIVMQAISRVAASGAIGIGAGGLPTMKPSRSKAGGYIPNFSKASPSQAAMESIAAHNAGYTAGQAFNTRIHDGKGGSFSATVNSAESIKTIIGPNGNKGTYVIPPVGMAARGFIPNFAGISSLSPTGNKIGDYKRLLKEGKNVKGQFSKDFGSLSKDEANQALNRSRNKGKVAKERDYKIASINATELGVGAIVGAGTKGNSVKSSIGVNRIKLNRDKLPPSLLSDKDKIQFTNVPVSPINLTDPKVKTSLEDMFIGQINQAFIPALKNYTASVFSSLFGDSEKTFTNSLDGKGSNNVFSTSVQGGLFESALKLASGKKGAFGRIETAPFDFEEQDGMNPRLKRAFFGDFPSVWKADAKRTDSSDNIQSLINKSVADDQVRGKLVPLIRRSLGSQKKNAAAGFIPNFAQSYANPQDRAIAKQASERSFFSMRIRSQIKWIQDYIKTKGLPPEIVNNPDMMKKLGGVFAKKYGGQGNIKAGEQGFLGLSGGYIPNFSNALNDALIRERSAGIPSSSIRIQKSAKLRNAQNPTGLAVTNTIDEPRGMADVFGNGYIPNFAVDGGLNDTLSKFTYNLPTNQWARNKGLVNQLNASVSGLLQLYQSKKISENELKKRITKQINVLDLDTNARKQLRDALIKQNTLVSKQNAVISKNINTPQIKNPSNEVDAPEKKGRMGEWGGRLGMAAMFASYSVGGYLEQQKGLTGDIGRGVSTGLQAGSIAAMVDPRLGLAVGLIAGISKALWEASSDVKELTDELSEMDEKISLNTNSSSSYIQKMEQLNAAMEAGDADKAAKIRTELSQILSEFDDKDFAMKLKGAGDSLKELGNVADEFTKNQLGKRRAKNIEREASLSEDEAKKTRGKQWNAKAATAVMTTLTFGTALFDKDARRQLSSGYGKVRTKEENDMVKDFQENILKDYMANGFSEDQKSSLLKASSGDLGTKELEKLLLSERSKGVLSNQEIEDLIVALVSLAERTEVETKRREVQANIDKQTINIFAAIKSALTDNINAITKDQQNMQFGAKLMTMFQSQKTASTGIARDAGYISEYDVGVAGLSSANSGKILEAEIAARNSFGEFGKKVYGQEGNFRKGDKGEAAVVETRSFNQLESFIQKGQNGEYAKKDANGNFSGIDTEKIKNEIALQKQILEAQNENEVESAKRNIDLLNGLLSNGIETNNLMREIKISTFLSKVLLERQQKQKSVSALSSEAMYKDDKQVVSLQKSINMLMSGKSPNEQDSLTSIRGLSDIVSQFAGTNTALPNLIAFGEKQRSLVENASQLSKAFGFSGLVQEKASTGLRRDNAIAPNAITERDTSTMEKIQSIANNAPIMLEKAMPKIFQSAQLISRGGGTDKDFAVLAKASLLEGLGETSRTQLENQRNASDVYSRAFKRYSDNENDPFNTVRGKRENKSLSDYMREEQSTQDKFSALNDIRKSMTSTGVQGDKEAFEKTIADLGLNLDMSKSEVIKQLSTKTDSEIQKALGNLSTDPVVLKLDEVKTEIVKLKDAMAGITNSSTNLTEIDLNLPEISVALTDIENLKQQIKDELLPLEEALTKRIMELVPGSSAATPPKTSRKP